MAKNRLPTRADIFSLFDDLGRAGISIELCPAKQLLEDGPRNHSYLREPWRYFALGNIEYLISREMDFDAPIEAPTERQRKDRAKKESEDDREPFIFQYDALARVLPKGTHPPKEFKEYRAHAVVVPGLVFARIAKLPLGVDPNHTLLRYVRRFA